MTWESVIGGALQGISNFVNSFVSIIGGCLNPAAVEGILALGAIAIIIGILDGNIRIGVPKVKIPKIPKRKKDHDDEDEWEYIRVRRRR